MAAKTPVRGRAASKSAATKKSPARAKPLARAGTARTAGAKAQPKRGAATAKSLARRSAPGKAAQRNSAARAKSAPNAQGRAKTSVKTTSKAKAKTFSKPKGTSSKMARPAKAPKALSKSKAPAAKAPAKAPAKKTPVKGTSASPPRTGAAAGTTKGDAPQRTGKALTPRKGPDGKSYSRLEHIDDATLDSIVAKLDEMRAESLSIVNMKKGDGNAIGEESDVGDDMDLASQDRDREFNLLMHERHLRRLQQIDEAYERIREGTYGLCEGTDEPINPRRLLIMPLARYSIEYQQEQEKTLGRTPEEFYFEDEAAIDSEEE